jgi:hypothetical protein
MMRPEKISVFRHFLRRRHVLSHCFLKMRAKIRRTDEYSATSSSDGTHEEHCAARDRAATLRISSSNPASAA